MECQDKPSDGTSPDDESEIPSLHEADNNTHNAKHRIAAKD